MSGILQGLIGSLKSAAQATTDAFFNLVTLLLNTTSTNGAQNNTFLDTSSIGNTVTRNGTPTQGTFTPFSQTGWSNNFNGSNAYLSLAATSAFAWGTGDLTIECWLYLSSTGTDNGVWDFRTGDSGQLFLVSNSLTSLQLYVGGASAYSFSVTPNAWNHIAVVRNSGTLKTYLNGVQVGSVANTTNFTANAGCNICSFFNGTQVIGAYISNFRAVKGTAVYTAAFTPPTTPLTAIANTQLLTCQSNRFLDSSANGLAITVNGTPSVQAFSPFLPTTSYDPLVVGGSGLFVRANSDILTLPNNSLLVGSSDFSLETWVYQFDRSGSMNFFGNQTDRSTAAGSSWNITLTNSNGYVESTTWVGSTPYNLLSPTAPDLNAWNYIVWCRTGSTQSIFVNGVRVATSSAIGGGSVNNGSTTYPPAIGANGGSASDILNGYLSGFKIIIGSGGYDATLSTLTVPTAPPTNTTNTKLLANFTNAGIFDAAAKNDLVTRGNAQVSTTQVKFGTTSMYFAADGDFLTTPYSPNLVFGTGDFTFECQLYWTGGANENNLIMNNASGGFNVKLSATVAANWGLDNAYVGQVADFGTAPTKNVWHHIAITRASGTLYAFIDGTQVFSGANSTNFTNTATWYVASNGFSSTFRITGYIDDLRITKGYARYTASFTPPTAAFQTLQVMYVF